MHIALLHYTCRNQPLFLKVHPTSIYCNSVPPLHTLSSVLGPSQSNKATTGSGLVQAIINNPPHSSEGRVKQGVEKWAARLLKVRSFEIRSDKCGRRNSRDQSGLHILRERKTIHHELKTKMKEFSQLCPSL